MYSPGYPSTSVMAAQPPQQHQQHRGRWGGPSNDFAARRKPTTSAVSHFDLAIAGGSPSSSLSNIAANSTPAQKESRVAMYTKYYHSWKAISEAATSTASEKEWATYYADLSSRAAHHYHQHGGDDAPAPSHELPPEPPQQQPSTVSNSNSTNANARSSSQPISASTFSTQNLQFNSRSSMELKPKANKLKQAKDPKRFEVYVDRCLQQCRSPDEKARMYTLVRKVLQESLSKASFHLKDWSKEPLLTLDKVEKANSSHGAGDSASYYGPSAGSTSKNSSNNPTNFKNKISKSSKSISRKRKPTETTSPSLQDSQNDSYYGPSPSTSSSSLSTAKLSSTSKSSKKQRADGFNNSRSAMRQRAQRFASFFNHKSSSSSFDDSDEAAARGPIVQGTCQTLEKDYLRLTSAPKPELVRPQPVLEKHFANLKQEYYGNVKFRREYLWFCSQLKAIRQDCTVQHLRNSFCAQVYEFHAKVAVEQGDLNEFNQCQTQLKYLYPLLTPQASPNRLEFLALRILYSVYLTMSTNHRDGAGGATADAVAEGMRSVETAASYSVSLALKVRSWVADDNYFSFFVSLEKMNSNVIDVDQPQVSSTFVQFLELMAPILRRRALLRLCAAYRPHVAVEFVCETLKTTVDWLRQEGGCVLSENEENLLTKETSVSLNEQGQGESQGRQLM